MMWHRFIGMDESSDIKDVFAATPRQLQFLPGIQPEVEDRMPKERPDQSGVGGDGVAFFAVCDGRVDWILNKNCA
jgi:hypothetical protein